MQQFVHDLGFMTSMRNMCGEKLSSLAARHRYTVGLDLFQDSTGRPVLEPKTAEWIRLPISHSDTQELNPLPA